MMIHVTSRAPIVRAAVLVGALFVLAVADGRDALGQPEVRDHRDTTTTNPNVTDHRKKKETRPGYRWVVDHWERVQAPKPTVPPPAVGPRPTPRPTSPPAVTGGTEISRCRVTEIECIAKCAVSPYNLAPVVGVVHCKGNCYDEHKQCVSLGRR